MARTDGDPAADDLLEADLVTLPFALALWFFRGVEAALLPTAIGALALAFSAALICLVGNFMDVLRRC